MKNIDLIPRAKGFYIELAHPIESGEHFRINLEAARCTPPLTCIGMAIPSQCVTSMRVYLLRERGAQFATEVMETLNELSVGEAATSHLYSSLYALISPGQGDSGNIPSASSG